MAHKDMGFELIKRVIDDLAEHGKPESMPRMMGRSINVMIVPVKRTKSGAAAEKEKNDDA
jgi:translation initiation factor IF-3